jgi:hypothetical protein
MCEIYKQGLLASASKFFGKDNLDWFLQEDNDPKHRSKIAKTWKQEKGIRVLPWPSMSPDQNPIENVWHVLKLNVSKKKMGSASELQKNIMKEWKCFSPEFTAKLVGSMERRIAALVESNGDYTLY